MNQIRTVAEYIPARARQIVYSVLGAAVAVELIWDAFPDAIDGKILKTLGALGFGLAAANTTP